MGKIGHLLLLSLILVSPVWVVQGASLGLNFSQLTDSHDIPDLPVWGPYSKKYAGISHIPDLQKGLRFDFCVLPGRYRGEVLIPNVLFQSGYYPWNANAADTKITYRYELEWKDKVYVDVTYSLIASNSVLVAIHCVNDTRLPEDLALNLMASIDYPAAFPLVRSQYPKTTRWINAIHYTELKHARVRPGDNLVFNGWMRSEARGEDYLDGSAVAAGFGAERGDIVKYDMSSLNPPAKGVISVRYRLKKDNRVTFNLKGLANQNVTFTGTGRFEMLEIPYSQPANGASFLTLESEGGGEGIELNGFFIGPRSDVDAIRFEPVAKKFTPKVILEGTNQMILKYPDIDNFYGIGWDFSPSVIREFLNDDLDVFFRKMLQDHVDRTLVGNRLGDYENVFLRPVELPAHGSKTIYALLCNGSQASVAEETASFAAAPAGFIAKVPPPENPYQDVLPAGRPYIFSQKMMRATMLANLVYPVYTQEHYIRHFSPGKWWDSLYTWDEGFIALGLEDINLNFAVECLNAYTTPPGSQSAFILHGSPVPTQAYAFFDLWNRTQSPELLRYFYPRLRQYYEFLAGNEGSSTTRMQHSHLLRPWDYFYNSGGWDDYPAQLAVHSRHWEESVTPVVTTAQCIRFAKILRMAAQRLSLDSDVKGYDADIAMFSSALQRYAWDPKSGYFGYVVHDQAGNPIGLLRTSSGQNYNEGLDGAYPLFAGICTPEQEAILLGKIFSSSNMWTPSGICVVDQSAEYYRKDGYWNGTVWMAHQWLMWKTMLDLGRPDLAWTIAHKALEVWKTETDDSYNVFEHFLADNGRGAGWHQFSSLSAPVINWFTTYFKPGTVTCGFEILITSQSWDASLSRYQADLAFDDATASHQRALILCLNPAFEYRVTFNGKPAMASSLFKGLLQITLPATNKPGRLIVQPLGK